MILNQLWNDIGGFFVLAFLELILGMDNLVFLAIMTEKLPAEQQQRARRWGLTLAWSTRLILLGVAVWLTAISVTLLTINDFALTVRDLVLLFGGIFLLYKATTAIHEEIEKSADAKKGSLPERSDFWMTVLQIGLLDIVFSIDSVITAVGITNQFWTMAAAITIAVIVMITASDFLCRLVNQHPTLKMLALCFLLLIGVMLIADGLHHHFPRGYLYFAIGFSLAVELFNYLVRRNK